MTLQQEIIKALGAKPHINPEEEIRRSVDFLKAYLQRYPFLKSPVLGISGDKTQRWRANFARPPSTNCVPGPVTMRCNLSPFVCPMAFRLMSRIVRTPSTLSSRTAC